MLCEVKTPWVKNLGDVPAHLDYPDCSMYEALEQIAKQYPDYTACVFMGRKTSYRQLVNDINICARALKSIGIRRGDKVTIAMPNCPQAVTMFYAVNLVGAIANMIHPLSSEKEIEFYLKESGSITAITLDQFYHKFEAIRQNVDNLDNIMGKIPSEELVEQIKKAALSVDKVCGAHDIRINYFGSYATVTMHIEVPQDLNIVEAHEISHKVQDEVISDIDIIHGVTVHTCPVGIKYDHTQQLDQQ